MKNNIEIVMLGDSIIGRGDWKKLLERKDLVNLGLDGDTTTEILGRISRAIELKPNILFLMVGVNDLCSSIHLDEVFENYTKILQQFKDKDIRVVVQAIFLTQMPAVNKKVRIFNPMLEKYCKEENIDFLNLNKAFSNKEGLLREDLTTDGLHLGLKAYNVWAYKINKIVNSF